jgi:NADH-quinone oxidoreductase subunit I
MSSTENKKEQSALCEYFSNIYTAVKSISIGLKITMRAFLKTNGWVEKKLDGYNYGVGAVTIDYPTVKDNIPYISRNRLFNDVDGCISCNQCAVICPVDCITIHSRKKTSDENPDARTPEQYGNKPLKLKLLKFEIDEALCCFCGLCTEVCPTECLTHTTEYEYSKYDRDSLAYEYTAFKDANPLPK